MSMLALSELRRRASSGDVEAQLSLGARLLTGDDAPLSVAEGTRLIGQAFVKGSAEAAAMLATIEAVGAGRPQNWPRALDFLQLAAERRLPRARAQMALLNRDAALAAELEAGEPFADDIWKRVRASLDIDALTASPPRRPLSENPRIRVVEGFATAAECDWAVSVARERLKPAEILDPVSGGRASHPDRTNSAMGLNVVDTDLVIQVLRARIANATNLPLPVFEPAQIMHYSVGEEFRAHHDFIDASKDALAAEVQRFGQRIATFLLYLNDDFEGGETQFPSVGLSYRGGKGDALFFANVDRSNAPDPLTLHAGRPPVRGEKWILSQWIRDRSPAPPPPGG